MQLGLPEEDTCCRFSFLKTLQTRTWLGAEGPGQSSPLLRIGGARKHGTAVVRGF